MKESPKILIVEDERIVAEDIKKTLKDLGYVVSSIVYSAVEAIKEAEETKPDLVLMDIKLRGNMDGVEAARHIRARFDIPCVYITALSDRETFQRAKMTEPFGYVHKPVEEKELCTAIEIALYRYNMEKRLKESEEKYRSLTDDVLDSSKVGIFILDSDFRVVWMNSSLESYFGIRRDEVIGKDKRELILRRIKDIFEHSETYIKKVLATYNNNTYIENFECHVIPDNNREERWLEHWSQPICSGLFAGGRIEHYYDITQAKRAEKEKERLHAQLTHSEKMAGIGTLASGIAHEFNNLLQIMRGHVEFAQKTKRAEDVEEALDRVIYNADRATKIIKDLLAFSNPEVSEKEMCNIIDPLESALSLIEKQLEKQNIKVLRKCNVIPKIEVNRTEMQQVFLNMIINARDSILPKGGKLEIRVKQVKENIEISFNDSGKGIDGENLKRLFEPFFTTKGAIGGSNIQGTGLGLSVSYGIVKRHGGTIEVDNKQIKGTTFTIKLPVKKSGLGNRNIKQKECGEIQKNQDLNILIVDDEEEICKMFKKWLSTERYKVQSALTGKKAINLIKKDYFDIVFLDIVMPGMSAAEVLDKIKKLSPKTRVVVMTGKLLDKNLMNELRRKGCSEFLQKPFKLEDIVKNIKRLS